MSRRSAHTFRGFSSWVTCLFGFMLMLQAQPATTNLNWSQLPSIPNPAGFAAPFAGVSGGALIVAGGANFPEAMPWAGGKKTWHNSIYVLPKPDATWVAGGSLPRQLAYGVSVSVGAGVLCAGGSNEREHFREVFLLQWKQGKIESSTFPTLPHPMANGCGALVDNTFYLAGGTDRPDATNARKTFWALDLSAKEMRWRELEPWPGPARMLAVAGVGDGSFMLFSGVELCADSSGKPVRRYLQDGYRFTPGKGWKRLADLPRAAAAAPSPAVLRGRELLLFSGDDGALVNFEPKSEHPGFPRDMLAYDWQADRWRLAGTTPLSRATVPTVTWANRAVIPNGEVRPGRRTPEVWALDLEQ